MIRMCMVLGIAVAVVAAGSEKSVTAQEQFNGVTASGNGVTVIVPNELLVDRAAEKRFGSAAGTFLAQAKTIQEKLGNYKKKVVIEISDKLDAPEVVVTKEQVTVKHPAKRVDPVNCGVSLVLARAADLGAKDPKDGDPAILAVTFYILIPADQEKSIADALKTKGVMSAKRLGEYNTKAGPRLTEEEGFQLPGTVWVLAKHWTQKEKKSLSDLVILPATKLPDPEVAKTWFLKKE